jgi:germination protein M
VVSKNFGLSFGTVDEQVSELLTALEATLWTEDEKDLITDRNPIYEYKIDGNGVLSLRYSSDYSTTPSLTEVLRRAALVKTLCQLDKITAVEFYIGTQPLLTSAGKPVGMLTAKDFIDSTGENTEFYQEAKVAVYFANETGDALRESYLKITYDGTVSTERLILQTLLEGPVAEDMQPVIPKGTVLNKVNIRDGICYVDFNEKFMEKRDGITAEVAVYSVVNSLTELSSVYKVQFLINGATKKNYGNLDFSNAFERNLEIVEGEQ